MIEGGWPFVIAAYCVSAAGLGALVLWVSLRARFWAKRAQQLEERG